MDGWPPAERLADRRRGVASRLLHRLSQWFAGRYAPRVCVDVEPSNAVARKFYARHGARELNPHWFVWDDITTVSWLTPSSMRKWCSTAERAVTA